jgi:hypothetical protein
VDLEPGIVVIGIAGMEGADTVRRDTSVDLIYVHLVFRWRHLPRIIRSAHEEQNMQQKMRGVIRNEAERPR